MTNDRSQQIAFLGLGLMGSSMSANLARKGFAVKGWNRTPSRPSVRIAKKAGVTIVSSIKKAIESADFVFTCVGDVPGVEEVILGEEGVINHGKPGGLVVDFSTIGTDAARHLGTQLKHQNFRFLDAPISGGDLGAQQGTLTIMVGGEITAFKACKPYFEAMGKTIIHCGLVGSGQGVKMCNQTLCAVHMVALCEAIKMAEKQGIDPTLIIEICSTGAASSWALNNLGAKIVEGDYNPGFAIKYILKDLRLVKETIKKSGDSLPGVDLAEQLFRLVSKMDNGEGLEQGTQAMIRYYQSKH
ncbi:MAG: NAD(P)-dependent oxidoreductase [cyanobacterium endosymbiont of Rhopalodia musculus]|uniref:NAD(P)-dependent oxidoreductase n=1 Tax=cyanobacterium endosymbiont of Epithemia clementina EcSB TaxID=3034674 RepID=UPI00247FE0E4|nr:NAD(P)-dependent oxidoreductase [cyanobacterium endosymbiont of Epithemia clementina EcSB]WGT68277.1 NAD(P)-dependent oxidoreductase [cyanobacterium endosymbiont of Epithemia clementina EcSB]